MKNLNAWLTRFVAEESAATSIEYAMVASLIAVACVLAIVAIGLNTEGLFTTICSAVNQAVNGVPGC